MDPAAEAPDPEPLGTVDADGVRGGGEAEVVAGSRPHRLRYESGGELQVCNVGDMIMGPYLGPYLNDVCKNFGFIGWNVRLSDSDLSFFALNSALSPAIRNEVSPSGVLKWTSPPSATIPR